MRHVDIIKEGNFERDLWDFIKAIGVENIFEILEYKGKYRILWS